MTSVVSQSREERGEVVRVERLDRLLELTVRLPALANSVKPGEFAQLRCGRGTLPLLRRPFSVAWTNRECCGFVFQVVGSGTAALAAMRPGDTLDVLGPLGRGFSIEVEGPVLCVSGGVGCAPFPILIEALRRGGVADITVLNGAAGADRLYPADRFSRGAGGIRVIEATDDGSRGHHGRVTELLDAALRSRPETVYACGPNRMLAAVHEAVAASEHAPRVVEASMEAPMGCGFGTCLGCALPLRGDGGVRWALCCSDGPVFSMHDVDWTALRRLPEAHVA